MSTFSVLLLLLSLCHWACVEGRAAAGLEHQLQTNVGSGSVESTEADVEEITDESSRKEASDKSVGE